MELFHPFPFLGSKNFFRDILFIWSKGSKISWKYFWNRKWNYWNYFSISRHKIKNIFKIMMLIWSKDIFIWSNDSKICFENRKWNFLHRKWNYLTRLQSSDQKTSFRTWCSFDQMITTDDLGHFGQHLFIFLPIVLNFLLLGIKWVLLKDPSSWGLYSNSYLTSAPEPPFYHLSVMFFAVEVTF